MSLDTDIPRASDSTRECTDTLQQEEFLMHQRLFDEVSENLPSTRLLIGQIKHEYDSAIRRIRSERRRQYASVYSNHIKRLEVGSISNYLKRIMQLSTCVQSLKDSNERLLREIESLRHERALTLKKRESEERMLRQHMSEAMNSRRCGLKLTIEDSTDVTQLQREIKRVDCELVDAMEILEKKYVNSQKKMYLQKQLKEKEGTRNGIAKEIFRLHATYRNLKLAVEASDEYHKTLEEGGTDLSLLDFIQDNILSYQSENRDLLGEDELDISSIELHQDPIVEMETEVILDCFEKFNELFESENYKEAALHAATSPRGVLRTMDTLNKFKVSARHLPGQKLPLLYYCETLVRCSSAYNHLSQEETLQCIQCAVENGVFPTVVHWIAQGLIPFSVELGVVLLKYCKCALSCGCGYKNLAFTVFEKCGAHQQAALCLALQGKYLSFLQFAEKRIYNNEVYVIMLYNCPKAEFARHLISPSSPYHSCLTPCEAVHSLLQRKAVKETIKLLQGYQDICGQNVLLEESFKTSLHMWKDVVDYLQDHHHQDLELQQVAVELLSTLTVQSCLVQAMDRLLQEQAPRHSDSASTSHIQSLVQTPLSEQDQRTSPSELSSGSSYVTSDGSESESGSSTEDADVSN